MANEPDPYSAVVERALIDPILRARLLGAPAATLREAGVAVPDGVAIKVVENTGTLVHLVLPPVTGARLADWELDQVAGGLRRPGGTTGQLAGFKDTDPIK